jgi:hypothetical protein
MGPNDLLGSNDPIAEAIAKQMQYKGLPYEGRPYTVSKDNPPILKRKVHIKQFNLSSEKDLHEYNEIFQGVADGLSIISFEERVYDADLKSWRVLLRWYDLKYTEPKNRKEVKDDKDS